MSKYLLPQDHVIYNFRYFLPHAPLWGSRESCDRRLAELIEFCRNAKIDAVQFFVNTRYGTYYMPAASAAEQREWIEWMAETVRPAMQKAGISYQLNFQMLLGCGGWGLDLSDCYDWKFMIDQFGEKAEGCPCPADKRFREVMGEMLRAWSSTKPEAIWIDDDFRLHNHKIDKSRGIDFYCFCPEHLERFATVIGKQLSRNELTAELLKSGPPSAIRLAWLDFCRDEMIDLAEWINREIHSVAPDCRIALMTSINDVHAFEGRDWPETLKALCSPDRPMTRPCGGLYSSSLTPVADYGTAFRLFESSRAMHAAMAPDADFGPELENSRFTTWANSVAFSKYVLELGQLLGMNQITLSMADLEGSPLSEEPTNEILLAESKARLQAIADLDLRSWRNCGVHCLIDPALGRKLELPEHASFADYLPERPFEEVLVSTGTPLQYTLPRQLPLGEGEILLLEKATVWCLSDAELKQALTGNLLLDAEGAREIQNRGLGKLLGVKIGEEVNYAIQSEFYFDGVLDGVHACRVPHKGYRWRRMELDGGTRTTEFLLADDTRVLGSSIFRNDLGGRVAVYGKIGNCKPYAAWGSHARKRYLNGVLRFLSDGTLPLIHNRAAALTVVKEKKREMLLAVANLSLDFLTELEVGFPFAASGVNLLDGEHWRKAEITSGIPCQLPPLGWLILKVEKSS